MTDKPNLESFEKYFFAYILENPNFFHRVEPVSFQNGKIRFIYQIVRDHYLSLEKPVVPSNHRIFELVKMHDGNHDKVSKEFIKNLLNVDISEVEQGKDDEWFKKTIQSWCVSCNLYNKMYEAVDYVRDLNPIDYENTEEVASKVKEIVNQATLMNFDDESLGLDFDDPDSHIQDVSSNKIPTGWHTLDELLDGGWDMKTLNMIIGPSNSGKSLWLNNIGVNAADHGKNVLYVTLEMAEKKVMKRMGAMRLRIPIDDYDTKSKDKNFIQSKIKQHKASNAIPSNEQELFNNPQGKIFVKEFPSGTATVSDIDNHVKRLQEEKGIKIDMVLVDYITIMAPDDKKNGSLFTNGKQLSEGLRAIGQKYDATIVSAMQTGKENVGAGDINLTDISESKAIYENSDVMLGIIRTENMRREGKYILKLLKMRDGDFKWEKTHFELNKTYLSLENDVAMET